MNHFGGEKKVECKKWRCWDNVDFHKAIAFGKYDLALLVKAPNLYWTSRQRMMLHEKDPVGELFSVPCHRVVWVDDEEEREKDNVAFSHPIVAFTFIRPMHEGEEDGRFETGVPHQRVVKLLRALKKMKNAVENESLRIDVFMTFSSYRILLKWEFDDISQFLPLISDLRKSCAGDIAETSTIFCLNATGENIPNWSPKKQIELSDDREGSEKSLFALYFRFKAPSGEAKFDKIVKEVRSYTQFKVHGDIILQKAGYWDAMILIEANDPRSVVGLSTGVIRKTFGEFLLKNVTVPFLVGSLRSDSKIDAVPEVPLSGDYPSPILPSDTFPAVEDAYNRNANLHTAYQVELELMWLLTRVHQLQLAWQAKPILLPRVASLPTLTHLVVSDAQMAHEILCFGPQIEKNRVFYEDAGALDEICDRLALHNNALNALLTAYNERLEGLQLSNLMSPYVRVAEQAGVFDLALQSIDKLMADYCGIVKEKLRTDSNLIFKEGMWKGLVITSFRTDLSLWPDYSLLFVPVTMKLAPHNILTSIAHEAAHFLTLNSKVPEGDDEEGGPRDIHSLSKSFADDLLECFNEYDPVEDVEEENRDLGLVKAAQVLWQKRSDMIHKLQGEKHGTEAEEDSSEYSLEEIFLLRYGLRGARRFREELFTDLLTSQIGGPTFFLDVSRAPYRTTFGHHQYLVPLVARVILGLRIGETAGWDTRWMEPILEQFIRLQKAQFNDYAMISKDVMLYLTDPQDEEIDYEELIKFSVTLWITDCMWRCVDEVLQGRKCNHVEKLVKFFNDNFEKESNPLFFPVSDLSEIPDVSGRIFEHCEDIAARIFNSSEVVAWTKPRYVSAASSLSPLRRPHYPTAVMYHSILYSKQS